MTRLIFSEAQQAAPPPGTRLVLMADDLLSQLGARDDLGNRLTFEWGEPDEHGWYTLTVTVHHDDNIVQQAQQAADDRLRMVREKVAFIADFALGREGDEASQNDPWNRLATVGINRDELLAALDAASSPGGRE